MMETFCASEMSVYSKETTGRYIQEGSAYVEDNTKLINTKCRVNDF
jgi:hypothetical protein